MGYDLHITRKKNWDGFDDKHGPEISLEEWKELVNDDPEFRLDGFCEIQTPEGRMFRCTNPSIAVWTRWSGHGQAGDMAWFALSGGNVAVKNPDREIRRKMWRVAQVLKAKVQGDENEFYDCFGNPIADASATEGYWRPLCRHIGFKFIWGDPVGGDIPPQPFARFPVWDDFRPKGSGETPQAVDRRALNIVIPKGSGTPEQLAAIEAARERAKSLGVDLIVTEE
jgi:hypothetical protein